MGPQTLHHQLDVFVKPYPLQYSRNPCILSVMTWLSYWSYKYSPCLYPIHTKGGTYATF